MDVELSYEITDNSDFFDEMFGITEELKDHLIECFPIAAKGKRSGLKKIKRLIEKFPNSPQLKNLLTVWYSNTNS